MVDVLINLMCPNIYVFCFFKQKTAYDMRISDWSSDVCSSDLVWTRPNLAAQSLAGRLHRCSSTNARKARIAGSLRAVMTALGQSRQPQKGCAQGEPGSAKGLLWKPAQAASQTSCSPSSTGPTVSADISDATCSGASRSACSAVGGSTVGIAAATAARKASATAASCKIGRAHV